VNDPLGPVALILLTIPAIALRFAILALYGRRRLTAADPMQMLLSLSSAILFVLAGLGIVVGLMGLWFLIIPLPVAFVILVLMIFDRSRHSEHRALLWSLSAAAEKGVPLSEAARAYADETLGDTGVRALALAEAIERGEPLAQAVRSARLRMGAAMKLAVRLGERLGVLGPAMRQQLDESHLVDAALSNAVGRLCYLFLVFCMLVGVFTFSMFRFMPVIQRIYFEFGQELPPVTRWVLDAADRFADPVALLWIGFWMLVGTGLLFGLVFGVLLAYDLVQRWIPIRKDDSQPRQFLTHWRRARFLIRIAGAVTVFSVLAVFLFPISIPILVLLHYVGWFPRDLPGVWRLFRRYDGALVMRGLALSVRRGLPLPQALALLQESYPLQQVARQLARAREQVAQGGDWCESLRQTGLIGRADSAVLAAGQRVGNLEWALEEMADSAMRRQTYWVQLLVQILFPALLLVLAAAVFVFVLSVFWPLVSMIQGLTYAGG